MSGGIQNSYYLNDYYKYGSTLRKNLNVRNGCYEKIP